MWPCNIIITEIRRRGKVFAPTCMYMFYAQQWDLRISVKWWGKTFWKPHLKVTNLFKYWFIYFMCRSYLVWNVMKKIPFFNCSTMQWFFFPSFLLFSLSLSLSLYCYYYCYCMVYVNNSNNYDINKNSKKAFKVIESHSTTHSKV